MNAMMKVPLFSRQKTTLKITDSSKDIAQKIHGLEYEYFPKTIEKTILKNGS